MYPAAARSSFNKALPFKKERRTVEQQPFKRVGQENFTTNPKTQQCSQKGSRWWRLASHLAEMSREAGQAQALEAVHLVLTARVVQTRCTRTLVDVPLAVLTGEARGAHAPIAVYQVLREKGTRVKPHAEPENRIKGEGPRQLWRDTITAPQLFRHIFLARAQHNNVDGNSI